MKFACLFSLVLPLALITGCADGGGATATAGAAINTVCPCMGGKIDGETSTEWNGKTVGFCCPPCIDVWNEMSDEERTAALAEAEDNGTDHADHEHGHDHDHGDALESGEPGDAVEEPSASADTPE